MAAGETGWSGSDSCHIGRGADDRRKIEDAKYDERMAEVVAGHGEREPELADVLRQIRDWAGQMKLTQFRNVKHEKTGELIESLRERFEQDPETFLIIQILLLQLQKNLRY